MKKAIIDPHTLFSYNPEMLSSHTPTFGGFYRPDHDPPFKR